MELMVTVRQFDICGCYSCYHGECGLGGLCDCCNEGGSERGKGDGGKGERVEEREIEGAHLTSMASTGVRCSAFCHHRRSYAGNLPGKSLAFKKAHISTVLR